MKKHLQNLKAKWKSCELKAIFLEKFAPVPAERGLTGVKERVLPSSSVFVNFFGPNGSCLSAAYGIFNIFSIVSYIANN